MMMDVVLEIYKFCRISHLGKNEKMKVTGASWCPIAKFVYELTRVYAKYSICWMHHLV